MESLSQSVKVMSQLQVLELGLYQDAAVSDLGLGFILEALQGKKLSELSIDLSGLYNLTDEGIQLLFESLKYLELKKLTFKILDATNFGGIAFYRMKESFSEMFLLQLHLKISMLTLHYSFENLNKQGLDYLSQSIQSQKNLKKLTLQFSDINIYDEYLDMLLSNLTPNIQQLFLDISANRFLNCSCLNKITNLNNLKVLKLNLQFMPRINQQYLVNLVRFIKVSKIYKFYLKVDRLRNYLRQLVQCLKEKIMLVELDTINQQQNGIKKFINQYIYQKLLTFIPLFYPFAMQVLSLYNP